MSKGKRKGTLFEHLAVAYMARRLGDDRIERRVLAGNKDRGDVAGLRFRGRKVVVECKNQRRMELSEWLNEAEDERGNDDAAYGIVVHKRKGCGEKSFGRNYVTMELDTFLAMVAGGPEYLED